MAAEGLPDRRVDAIAQGLDVERARDLLRRELDFGCRPQVRRLDDDTYEVLVIGTEKQLEELRGDGFDLRLPPPVEREPYEIGDGDRFAREDAVPRGFGEKVKEPILKDVL